MGGEGLRARPVPVRGAQYKSVAAAATGVAHRDGISVERCLALAEQMLTEGLIDPLASLLYNKTDMEALGSYSIFLIKGVESLAGAESEFVNGRFNNCANRCYYACFQAAVAALLRENVHPAGDSQWAHPFVHARFAGTLVHSRKLHPSGLRDTLPQNLMLRQRADYEEQHITETQAYRALRRTREFLELIRASGGERG